ncbi:UDP-glucose dehydrogenase family protein [Cohnella sp. GCM10027633]|uniref:UDP-glucose dehydrogenase family protein n=1 Tax=unclassified Cohnella TaxID=2636738 RepID=UPI00363745B8
MNVVVAGVGYVGLVTAVCLAEQGHTVTCVDVDEDKMNQLRDGKCSIYESGLEEMMARNRDGLAYTTNGNEAYRHADLVLVCVGTPEKKDGSANLAYVHEVVRQIADAAERDCVVAVKSTVPVGTNDKLSHMLEERLRSKRKHVRLRVVSNPEFLSQGTAIKDTLNATRIVIGAEDETSVGVMKRLYDPFGIPYVLTDRKSAEMIKYAANDYLALKISYINEIANLCEIIGANVEDVARGMGMDKRIGDRFLNAGIGYGGSCFPKDTKALHWLANYNDYELKTIKAAIEVNEGQKIRLLKKARKHFDSFEGLTIAILGVTFKPDTDDLREAPSIANIPYLLEDGAKLRVWDPVGLDNLRKLYDDELAYCRTIEEAIADADACFIFTEWREVKSLDLGAYARLMRTPIVFDGRNCYATADARDAGIRYESIGRSRKTERVVQA